MATAPLAARRRRLTGCVTHPQLKRTPATRHARLSPLTAQMRNASWLAPAEHFRGIVTIVAFNLSREGSRRDVSQWR